MGKREKPTSNSGAIQVFELTMDNPENQDELNRRLKKPSEADLSSVTKLASAAEREAAVVSAELQKGKSSTFEPPTK